MILGLIGMAMPQPMPQPMPQSQSQPQPRAGGQAPGDFIIPPLPPGPGGPVAPVVPLGPLGTYPAGFIPLGGPQPPVIPAIERSPSVQSPVIPEPPLGWGMPEPSGYPSGPVRPAEVQYEEYPPSGPSREQFYRPQEPDELAIPSPPSDVSHALPVPGPDTFIIPQSRPESRISTSTQETYTPASSGPLPIPVGGEVPAVIPIAPSVGSPRLMPQPIAVPPPGQIVQPGAGPIVVQTTPVQPMLGQPAVPIPPSAGPIVITPGPVLSRPGSRAGVRDPVVVVPSSQDRSPVQIPATIVQIPTSGRTQDEPIRTSPSIHAGERHEVSRSPPPRRRRGSRSYSPDDYRERYPPYDRYRYRDRYYSPDRGYRRYGYYSPRRRRRSDDYDDEPEDRPRRGYRRRDDRYHPESEEDEGRSPEGTRRRPSRRSEYPDTGRDPDDRSRAPPSQREGDIGAPSHPASTQPLSPAPPTIIRLGPREPGACRSLVLYYTFILNLLHRSPPLT